MPSIGADERELTAQGTGLLDFARGFPHPLGGAAWLDDDGRPDYDQPVRTWVTARMAHCYALGSLMGVAGAAELADVAIDGLLGVLSDRDNGGWHGSLLGGVPVDGPKLAYDHAFVLLAASSALQVGRPRARELFDVIRPVVETYFWDEGNGTIIDERSADLATASDYRGANASMHFVEAMLCASDATGDRLWLDRAVRVVERIVLDHAASHDWRIPEHYGADWRPDLSYNRDRPADPFKPFGATPGHGLEWSRLLLELAAADPDAAIAGRLLLAAEGLYTRAVGDGWARNGEPGFLYTTDFNGQPIVEDRMHWVLCEAIGAAATLWVTTGKEAYAVDYDRWWGYARRYLVDGVHGSWHHQLSPRNLVDDSVWPGKPDIYHAFQATLIPRIPVAASIAHGLRRAAADQTPRP